MRFGSFCQGCVFHQPKQLAKTRDISVFIAPLAERGGTVDELFIFFFCFLLRFPFSIFLHVHSLPVCFAPGLVHMKNTDPEARNVEQTSPSFRYSETEIEKNMKRYEGPNLVLKNLASPEGKWNYVKLLFNKLPSTSMCLFRVYFYNLGASNFCLNWLLSFFCTRVKVCSLYPKN